MVRTISGTLTTAIGAKSRRPAFTLTAEDHIMHLQNSVSTPANTNGVNDGFSDLCVANDGSIIRVRITWVNGADFQQNFQWQRITDPTSQTQWQTWTTFTGGSANIFQQGGCCVSNNSGTLRAFAQQGFPVNQSPIWNWYSFDNGQTWSNGPGTVLTLPGNALIKGIASAGNNDVFFLYDTTGGDSLGASFYSGAWSALVHTASAVTQEGKGVGVLWSSSTAKYTIVYADFYAVYEHTYTPGSSTWTFIATLSPQNTTAILRSSPHLSLIDGVYTLIYSEVDYGIYTSTIYSYPRVRQSVDLVNWSTGYILHDMPTSFGCNLIQTITPNAPRNRYIAATMTKVEYSNVYAQSDTTQYVDLSHYVLEYKREEDLGYPGKFTVLLDNSSGALNSSVSFYGSTYKPIGLNTTLVLSEGYYTGTPPTTKEVVQVGKYHVKQIVFERSPSKSEIQIIAQDISSYFDNESRYQYSYANNTVQSIIQNISPLAGVLNTNVPGIAQLTATTPTFVLHAGRKYRSALDEASRVGWVEYFLDQNEVLQVIQLNANDAAVWTYNPEIETLVLGSDDERVNHIIVSGKPPVGPLVPIGSVTNAEVFDDVHLHVTGIERFMAYTDIKLATQALCQNKASFLLQQEQRDQVAHSITVPANPALQLLDVITITDQGSSVSGTAQTVNARIYRQEIVFSAEKAEFLQIIYLEGV